MKSERTSLIKELLDNVSTCITGYEKYAGKNVFIRTVTMAYTGKVEDVNSMCLELSSAAWIADTGRFNAFLNDTDASDEVEPFPQNVSVGLGGIIDITIIDKLQLNQK